MSVTVVVQTAEDEAEVARVVCDVRARIAAGNH
jgi:hypothetical protein